MTRYWLRLLVMASPLILWPAIELFVLPIDIFTFRPWEALIVKSVGHASLGAFYPDQHLVKWSIGSYDMSARVANPRRQYEEWFTDANGYRNRPGAPPPAGYDVLLVGDSNIVGAFNTQDDILSEQLARACGCAVYGAGQGGALIRTHDGALVDRPPKVVVANLTWPTDPLQLLTLGAARFEPVSFARSEPSIWPRWALVLADRLLKQAGREWTRARLRVTELGRQVGVFAQTRTGLERRGELPPPRLDQLSAAFGRMAMRVKDALVRVGLAGASPSVPPAASPAVPASPPAAAASAPTVNRVDAISDEMATALIDKAVAMSDTMRAAGIDVIFLMDPHPNFPMYLPFVERLKARGVGVAYWQDWPPPNFPEAYWNKEDSHWTARAMREAAQLIAAEMRERGSLERRPQAGAVAREPQQTKR